MLRRVTVIVLLVAGCPGPSSGDDGGTSGGRTGGAAGGSAGAAAGGGTAGGGTAGGGTGGGGTAGGGTAGGGTAGGGTAGGGTAGGGTAGGGTAGGGTAGGGTVCPGVALLDGWCWEHPTPFGAGVYAAQALAPNDIWVAGDHGATYHFDGTRWRFHLAPQLPGDQTRAVTVLAFTSPTDGWALTSNDRARWNGTQWSQQSYDITGYALRDALVLSPSNIIVSHSVFTSRWNGTDWNLEQTWPVGLSGLWGAGPADFWATRQDGLDSPVYYFDGGGFAAVPVPQDAGLPVYSDVWGYTNRDVWVVGYSGSAAHFDGGTWESISTGTAVDLTEVAGTAPDDVWAIGDRGTAVHWNGTAFSVVDAGTVAQLTCLAVAPDAGTLIAGAAGTLRWGAPDGSLTPWSHSLTRGRALRAVHGSGPADVWAVGDEGIALHFDGSAWSRLATPVSVDLYAVFAVSPASAWAAGAESTVLQWTGSAWQLLAAPAPQRYLYGVWATGSDAWVVTDGAAWRWSGTQWSSLPAPATCCRTVFGFSATDLWFGGIGGIWHWNGSAFTNTWTGGTSAVVTSLWGSTTGAMFASLYDSLGRGLQLWNGSSWGPVNQVAGNYVISVHGSASNRVLAVAPNMLWTFNGSQWTSAMIGFEGGALWAGPPGHVRLVGRGGSVLRR